jgi:hypothetical protein
MRDFIAAVVLVLWLAGAVFAADKSEILKYQLHVDRLGPVIVGMTPKEAGKSLGMPVEYDGPANEIDQGCHFVSPKGYSKDIAFMIEDGRITRIDIISRSVASVKGIRIGDPEGDDENNREIVLLTNHMLYPSEVFDGSGNLGFNILLPQVHCFDKNR